MIPLVLGLLLGGYFLGSLPSGYLAGRWLKGIDIREQGSGSMGATNVLRALGKGPAMVVFAVDVLKGFLAVRIAEALLPPDASWAVVLVGLAAILGHSRPVWLQWRGGKSVAVSIGLLFGMNLVVAFAVLGIWSVTAFFTRIVSISSIFGAVAAPVLFYLSGAPLPFTLFGLVGGSYVVWLHRTNIERLLKGTEPRIGQS
jgi:acyl phosphate:glycerol-3-phosphate acyltransferase